jgi:hypothetical protein
VSVIALIAVLSVALVWLAVRVLDLRHGRLLALRLARSDIEATIASMPAELRDDWGEEWLAELEAVVEMPMMALFFALGLRRAARRLCEESGLGKPRRNRLRRLPVGRSEPRRVSAGGSPTCGAQTWTGYGEHRYGTMPSLLSGRG